MTRLDRALFFALLPAALIALALHTREVLRSGLAEPSFYVSAPERPDDHPRVTGFRLDLPASGADLRIGDRLLRIDGVDLRGQGHFGVDALALAHADADGGVEVVYERAGETREIRSPLTHPRLPWSRLPGLVAITLACVIVLLRSPPGAATRLFFVAFLLAVIFQSQFHGPRVWQTLFSKSLFYVLGAVIPALTVYWALHFPPEAPRPRRWIAALPWLVLTPAFGVLRLSYLLGGPVPPRLVPLGITVAHFAWASGCLAALTWNYRRSDPVGRRRVKWVMWSAWVGLTPLLLNSLFAHTEIGGNWYAETADWSKLAMVAVAIGLLLSMQRQSLFDVDRVLGATATYTLLLAGLMLGVSVLVPPAAEAASTVLGLASGSAQMALSAAFALALLPLHSAIRPRIDKAFFAERFAASEGVKDLLALLDRGAPEGQLAACCGAGLERAFDAGGVLVYERQEAGYALTWAGAEAQDPLVTIPDSHPVSSILRASSGPLLAEGRRSRRRSATTSPLAGAALETLGAQIVAPIRTPDALLGFLCLGPRRSRDIYTATDADLLSSVATHVALRLTHERERSLRRYVPDAIRSQLDDHEPLQAAEREVSVLFVDLRGYTGLAATHEAQEIFDALSRYTTRVSEIVRLFGGQVVEFHGDGLMAVFGAPEALVHKEREAVLAAREIVQSLRVQPAGALSSADRGFEAGVGIATGPAFVGNIRAVDRWIWSAVGNTTNLAARLQALTRELGAGIVIDDLTRARAGDAAADFVPRPGTQIRGLPESATVHTGEAGAPA